MPPRLPPEEAVVQEGQAGTPQWAGQVVVGSEGLTKGVPLHLQLV